MRILEDFLDTIDLEAINQKTDATIQKIRTKKI